jgi:uncharacterized membrane protein (UPF0127 family)
VPKFSSVFRILGVLFASLFVLTPLAACSQEGSLVANTSTGEYVFNVEIADTPAATTKGLMYRDALAPDAGMLFDFKESRPVSFWMKNTLIPLDMVFIREDGTVANVHVNARPLDLTGIPSDGPVRFVLEIAGGRSVEIGLKAGDTISHPRVVKPAS